MPRSPKESHKHSSKTSRPHKRGEAESTRQGHYSGSHSCGSSERRTSTRRRSPIQFDHKHPSDTSRNAPKPKRFTANEKLWKVLKRRLKERKARKLNFEQSEHHAICLATDQQLQIILQNDEFLSDIPYDCTLQELEGDIASASGGGITVYIQRDGLSTLTVVLPQEKPTIANLKRGIEATARIQLQRRQRQRHEDRVRRRSEQLAHNNNKLNDSSMKRVEQLEDDDCKQVSSTVPSCKSHRRRKNKSKNELPLRNAGELVYSEAVSGQQHRPNVSWRFLWRAYALINVHTKEPLNDSNGRTLLSECGIENASTLKFCNREKYFGKKRQR